MQQEMKVVTYFNIKQLEIVLKLLVKYNINKVKKKSWWTANKREVIKSHLIWKGKRWQAIKNHMRKALENTW